MLAFGGVAGDAALMLVRSWYPGLDLSVLTGMRVGSDEDVSSVWPDNLPPSGGDPV